MALTDKEINELKRQRAKLLHEGLKCIPNSPKQIQIRKELHKIMDKLKPYLMKEEAATLPPVPKNSKEMLKYYKDGMNFFYKELVTDNTYIPEELRHIDMNTFADNQFDLWFRNVDKLQDPEVLKLIEENKDKIYNKAKRDFSDFKPKGNALDLVFWYIARDWYKNYGEKLASQKRKEEEAERKRKAQEEREAKKQAKKEFISVKDIFDKGPNDVIWKFLNDYEKKTLDYFRKVKADYLKLTEPENYYLKLLKDLKNYRLSNDAKIAYLAQEKHYPIQDIDMAIMPSAKQKRMLEDDKDIKYAELVKRIYQKTKNKITDAKLHIASDGNINGYIYFDGGKVKIETILAWGEVYRPHYRVLVH